MGVLRELFGYAKALKIPMFIALGLAVAGAVLTIIGPISSPASRTSSPTD